MKKILILFLAIVMLTSCGKTDVAKKETKAKEEKTTKKTEKSVDKTSTTKASETTTKAEETTVATTESTSAQETESKLEETGPAVEGEDANDLILSTIMNAEPPSSYNALFVQENDMLGLISKNRFVWDGNRYFYCAYEEDKIAMADILDFGAETKYHWSPLYEPGAGVTESSFDKNVDLVMLTGINMNIMYDLAESPGVILAREGNIDGEKVIYVEYTLPDSKDVLYKVWYSLEKSFPIRQAFVQESGSLKTETTWKLLELDLNGDYPEFLEVPEK